MKLRMMGSDYVPTLVLRNQSKMSTCENCGAKATVYAMGPYAGDWGGRYCDLHIPTGFLVTDKIKN